MVITLEEVAKQAAGNHRKFQDFGWYNRPTDDENWTIVYTKNRDSRLLEESNADAIKKEMEAEEFGEDVVPECHNHFAVGWVEGYAIRVYDAAGNVTKAFEKYVALMDAIADYPVLDDEDYSRREYEATLKNIEQVGGRFVKTGSPEDWAEQVFSWLWNHDQNELENRDDQGGYPSNEAVQEALEALKMLDVIYLVGVGDATLLETEDLVKAERFHDDLLHQADLEMGPAAGRKDEVWLNSIQNI